MKDKVTLKELIAFVLRKGRAVILAALVCAIVLGAFMAVRQSQNRTGGTQESYQEAMEAYLSARELLLEEIADKQLRLERQEAHNDSSLLMKIDSCNTYKATVCMAISDVDDQLLNQYTSMDYLVSRIVNQYINYWNGLVLQDALENNPYKDSEEKYIRELMEIRSADGGVINLTVVASREEDAAMLAESAWKCLQDAQDLVTEGSYSHKVVLLSKTTKVVVDDALAAKQQLNCANLDTYLNEIAETEKQLQELAKPTAPEESGPAAVIKDGILGAVLGAVVGAVLAAAVVVAVYFFRGKVETSRELEQGLKLDFLGSAAQKSGIFDRMADGLLQERTWRDAEQAVRYIRENIRIRCDGVGTLALVTTLADTKAAAALHAVADALTVDGWTVRCIQDVSHNAEAAAAISECEQVLLAECAGASNWNQVVEALELTKRLQKEACGFILI